MCIYRARNRHTILNYTRLHEHTISMHLIHVHVHYNSCVGIYAIYIEHMRTNVL